MNKDTFFQNFILRSAGQLLAPLLGVIAVLLLFACFDEVRPALFSGANWRNILIQTVTVGLGAIGMTLIIVSGGIDLSAGSLVALSGVVGATLITLGWPAWAVVIGIISCGALCGAINGSLIAGLGITPFIVTLGTMGIARGAAKWVASNEVVNYPRDHFVNTIMMKHPNAEFWPLPPGVWICIALVVVMSVLMVATVFGRRVYAIGSNETAARLCGIRVRWNKLLIYIIGGAFFGLAGLSELSRISVGDPTGALGLELKIIAAVVIGGASLTGGSGTVVGAMIGALLMGMLESYTTPLRIPNYFQEIIIGIVIVIAVFVDMLRNRKRWS